MKYEILYSGAFAVLKVKLSKGESVKAESGAMVAMSSTCDIEGKLEGGLLGGLGRMFTGESFFFQTIKAWRGHGETLLAPITLGDIIDIDLDGSYAMCVQKGSFLAAEQSVQIDNKIQNLARGLFSGEGFLILKISGTGKAFLSSYGAIHPINLAEGEEMIIDNGHLVAWSDDMQYTVEKASSGWISSFTSGEGLVLRFKGPGPVLIQTRNVKSFSDWIKSLVPKIGS